MPRRSPPAGPSSRPSRAGGHPREQDGRHVGGILGIFFVSLRGAVQENFELAKTEGIRGRVVQGPAVRLAVAGEYTPATVGDRTVMDTLIPFAEAISSGNFSAAVEAAVQGAEATKGMKPRLGRATYVGAGGDGSRELPPDPGAWGAMVAIKGLESALSA